MKLEWAPRALRETEETGEYIAADRPGAAEAWLDGLLHTAERLETFPRSGRLMEYDPLTGYELREIIYGRYRVIYGLLQDDVTILRLVHTRRETVDE
jgi:toxin ParE1/3/4